MVHCQQKGPLSPTDASIALTLTSGQRRKKPPPHLAREHVNLVGALTNVAEQTLESVGRADIAVHRLRKRVKGQHLFFPFGQTPHGLWIEVSIFGFEGGQLRQRALFGGLSPDAQQFGLDAPFAPAWG
jgi:hypothetical protein